MKEWDPSFGPSYTPMEMLDLGIFEGIYTHAIESIPAKYKSHKNVLGDKGPDVEINRFKVKSRQSLKEWQKKKWTTELSPLGWWEWYIKYFEGRRDEKEDKLQIARWNSYVARHQGQIKANCRLGDDKCRPKQRQGLLQWGWDSSTAYTDDQVIENAKRMARLSGNSKLQTESFLSAAPDLIRLGTTLTSYAFDRAKSNKSSNNKSKPSKSKFNFGPTLNPLAYLPYVSVSEKNGVVSVAGFSMKKFDSAISDILGTSRYQNMFHRIHSRGFEVESFFVIEILKAIDIKLGSGGRDNKMLKSIREELMKNTWIKDANDAPPKPFKYENLKRLNINLLPKQMQFLEEYQNLIPKLNLKGWLLAAAPGTGKALKNGTWVKTPDDWCKIEDLEVGDIVIGDDGLPTTVTGVYPQGKVELYEITFYDGRKAIACGEHLWKINDGRLGKKPHDERWHVTNTKDIYDYFTSGEEFLCSIPLTKPIGDKKQLGLLLDRFDCGVVNTQSIIEAKEVSELVYSLGGLAKVKHEDQSYKVEIDLGADKLSIVDIKPVEADEATCISVDNESKLFLIDEYVVTHNTLTGYAWHMVQDFDVLVVVAPNNTVEDVWEKTFYRFFKEVPKYWLSRPNFRMKGDEEFIITHYEHLEKTMGMLNRFKGKRVGMWVDESHHFNELTSARTNLLIDLAKEYVEETVLASGTPLKALGKELVPLFRICDSLFTPSVEEKFIKTFGATKGAVLELLNYRMDRVSFKIHKSEVVNNVVKEVSQAVTMPNASKYTLSAIRLEIQKYVKERLAYYESVNDLIIAEYKTFIAKYTAKETNFDGFSEYQKTAEQLHLHFSPYTDGDLIKICSRYEKEKILPLLEPTERKAFKKAASKYKYPLLVVRGEALGRILTRRRIECMVDMVPYADLETMVERAVKKTVFFSNYVEIVKAMADHLKLLGFNPIMVHGETSGELNNNLKRFLEDPKANPIVTTYKSLSTGVPLVSASTIVLYDSPFRNYIVEQTIARADRLDQDSDIEVVRPYLDTGKEDNLSTRSIDLAEMSKEMVDSILKLDKVDTRLLSTEGYGGDDKVKLMLEYYSAGETSVELVECNKELYYVDIQPNPPSELTVSPTYPPGSEFAKNNHLPDHWVYDAAVERVELHSSIIGALRARYSEWKELIEKHGVDGLQFNVYKCSNRSSLEWINPTTLINYRYDYDAHFTDAWWTFDTVELQLVEGPGRVTAGKNGRRTPKGSYWFHCDDSTPFALIQTYGDESVIEHSPVDLEVIGGGFEEEIIIDGNNLDGRYIGTENYHEIASEGGDTHSCVYRKNDVKLYHISFKPLDRVLKPKLPDGSELKNETHWSAEPDIPRVCFSETIEGCVRAIYPNISHLAERYDELEFYVYEVPAGADGRWVPSWSLVEDGHVWDASVTKEWWSLSDTKIKLRGKVSVSFNTKGDWLTVKLPNGDKIEHSPLGITITN